MFKDDERIRAGELWLDRLQEAVEGCGAFVVLVGRDGVRRWIGAETQVALNRYFAPHDDAERLPIFPILLDGTEPETLPAFLRLFQMTPWNGADPLPERLLDDIRHAHHRHQRTSRVRGLPVRRARRLSLRIRRTCSSAGRRRRWTRSPASTPAGRPRPCAGWRSTATRAPASRR